MRFTQQLGRGNPKVALERLTLQTITNVHGEEVKDWHGIEFVPSRVQPMSRAESMAAGLSGDLRAVRAFTLMPSSVGGFDRIRDPTGKLWKVSNTLEYPNHTELLLEEVLGP